MRDRRASDGRQGESQSQIPGAGGGGDEEGLYLARTPLGNEIKPHYLERGGVERKSRGERKFAENILLA